MILKETKAGGIPPALASERAAKTLSFSQEVDTRCAGYGKCLITGGSPGGARQDQILESKGSEQFDLQLLRPFPPGF